MDEAYIKKIMTAIILAILIVLSFFLLRPILLSIVVGIILAYIFTPVYNLLNNKLIKSKDISAILICIFLIILIVLPFWFLIPIFIKQSFKVYVFLQEMDFLTPLRKIFPSFFTSEEFSVQIVDTIHSFVTKIANSLMNSFSQLLLNSPTLFLQFLVVSFTFYFVLRDKEELLNYIKSLLPFSKDIEKKLFQYSRDITSSVIYGQIVIGIIQGIITGAGFFIFGVPNALLLTLIAILAGIFPIIGTTIIWVPVVIYLLLAGNTLPAIGVTIFGLISSSVDNFIRPIIVSKKTKIHSALVLIGMVGGLFLFGVVGLILGPLILSYLLIILELYRNKKFESIVFQKEKTVR